MKIYCSYCHKNIPKEFIYDPLDEFFGLSKNTRWEGLKEKYFNQNRQKDFICSICSKNQYEESLLKNIIDKERGFNFINTTIFKIKNIVNQEIQDTDKEDESRESLYHNTIKKWFKTLSKAKRVPAIKYKKFWLPLHNIIFENEYMFKKDENPTEYIQSGWFEDRTIETEKCRADVVAIDPSDEENEIKLVIEIDFDNRVPLWKWKYFTENNILCFEVELRTIQKLLEQDTKNPYFWNDVFDFEKFKIHETNYEEININTEKIDDDLPF